MTTTVRIDPTLCRGHAICVLHIADGVELDRWGFARVVDPSLDSDRAVRRARRAAAACPNGAVSVIEAVRSGSAPVPVPEAVSMVVAVPAPVPVPVAVPVPVPEAAPVGVPLPVPVPTDGIPASAPMTGDHPARVGGW